MTFDTEQNLGNCWKICARKNHRPNGKGSFWEGCIPGMRLEEADFGGVNQMFLKSLTVEL